MTGSEADMAKPFASTRFYDALGLSSAAAPAKADVEAAYRAKCAEHGACPEATATAVLDATRAAGIPDGLAEVALAYNVLMASFTPLQPRFATALPREQLPGRAEFWQAAIHRADIYAMETAQQGKGGPFGAQLWAVNPATDEYVLVNQDSNAVVSKGLASAHAESENLSPENRAIVTKFLESKRGEEWIVVQVSSGESCHACRAKQTHFSEELTRKGLLAPGNFFILYKACYELTRDVADFNDLPYDMTFRLVTKLRVLDLPGKLFDLEALLMGDPYSAAQYDAGQVIYTPVRRVNVSPQVDPDVVELLRSNADHPFAVVVGPEGVVMSSAAGQQHATGRFEDSAPVAALHKAAQRKRKEGVFESWNLEGAQLFTNVSDIGPIAYGESLWFNISEILCVSDFASDAVDNAAQELPGVGNTDFFRLVASEYDAPNRPMSVIHMGSTDEPSVAHLYWRAKVAAEKLQNFRVDQIDGVKTTDLTGRNADLLAPKVTPNVSSHYNGKESPWVRVSAAVLSGSLGSLGKLPTPMVSPAHPEPLIPISTDT